MEVNGGAQDGNGDGSGDEAGTATGVETRRRRQDGNGDGNGDEDGNANKGRIGRAKERPRSARTRTRVVDVMWEKRETWVERGKIYRKERVGSVAASPDNLENNKEAGGGSTRHQGLK